MALLKCGSHGDLLPHLTNGIQSFSKRNQDSNSDGDQSYCSYTWWSQYYRACASGPYSEVRTIEITFMGSLIKIQDIDQFLEVVNVPDDAITSSILQGVRQLDERKELERILREILCDPTETPHGPTEIADILTTKVLVRGKPTLAAFVVKGRSFTKVRPQDIDYQVIRLRQLPDLGLMALVAVGHIQDSAQRDFLQMAADAGCDRLIIQANDLARLLIAYKKICPSDGTPYNLDDLCLKGHKRTEWMELKIRVPSGLEYEIHKLIDVSHFGVRRLTATLLVNSYYNREILREVIRDAAREVKNSRYHRNGLIAEGSRNINAQVIWLFLATSLRDIRNTNWLAQAQWIDPDLDPKMQPSELPVSERLDTIAIAWNESYRNTSMFNKEHSADKAKVLARLEPLIERATKIGSQIARWFEAFERGALGVQALTSSIRDLSPEISDITNQAMELPFPPEDVKDYADRAQNLFVPLENMALYYSDRGKEIWTDENRGGLMLTAVEDFRKALLRLEFEREKLH